MPQIMISLADILLQVSLPILSIMPDPSGCKNGMLNRYLHEQHAVIEWVDKKRDTRRETGGAAKQKRHDEDKQAVKCLDKQMSDTTDADLLKEARKVQQGMWVHSSRQIC